MVDVTVHDPATAPEPDAPAAAAPALTPSAELVKNALQEETVEDEKGRKILIRKPGPLAQYRLILAVGPEAAANQTYMQMVNPLIYVASIDGDVVHAPATLREVEALIVRLDDAGLGVVMGWYMANVMAPTMEHVAAAERAAALKN